MKDPIGAQIWSLRKRMQTAPEAVLETLAQTGYAFIEPAGFDPQTGSFQGIPARDLKSMAGYQGLKIPSAHIQFCPEDIHIVCEAAAELGLEYLVLPFLRKSLQDAPDGYRRAADEFNEAGEKAAVYGLRLAYHNHAHEFQASPAGPLPIDILLEFTMPEYLCFQADLGWIIAAGRDPNVYFHRHPGRFPLWHLRDIDPKSGESTVIGKGTVPFSRIFADRQIAGLTYAVVEMASSAADPLQELIESYPALRF
ncbi:sugar phosphate isomerase/epimerase [Niabella terrae]